MRSRVLSSDEVRISRYEFLTSFRICYVTDRLVGCAPIKLWTRVTMTNPSQIILPTSATNKRPQTASAVIAATVVLSGLGMMTSTVPLLVLASGVTLCLVVLLLWRSDDPPILLLPALFQWTEVAIVPISTVWLQVPLANLSTYGADIERSSLYGLLGVSALTVGLALGSGKSARPSFMTLLHQEATLWTAKQVIPLSLLLIGLGYGFAITSGYAGPAREPLNQAANIKYAGLFLLTFWCLMRKQHYPLLLLTICFEIGFGMTGFFAEFKNSILTFFVASITARPKVKVADILVVSFATLLIFAVAIFWSAIKPDYRNFVNQGTGAQVVSVPLNERISFLTSAALDFNEEKAADGFQRLVARHGYVEFLGLVMDHVPSAMEHQNGNITLAVLRHITVPRFLWPEKPTLPSDTEVMSKYTGLPMTWNSDTSISIGYLGELYADFGYLGGLIGAGTIGIAVGWFYSFVRAYFNKSAIICAGLCLMVAIPIAYFGTAYVKMVGAMVMSAAVVCVIGQFILPLFLSSHKSSVAIQSQRTRI